MGQEVLSTTQASKKAKIRDVQSGFGHMTIAKAKEDNFKRYERLIEILNLFLMDNAQIFGGGWCHQPI